MELNWGSTGILPPALKNRPKYDARLQPYLDAYNCLSCHRTKNDIGYNPISFESICHYADRYGHTKLEDFDKLRIMVQACDNAFLEYTYEKLKPKK